ncbi:MAG: sulfatase-like hydrolase/transferase [Verrucomicrobiota bacterium]
MKHLCRLILLMGLFLGAASLTGAVDADRPNFVIIMCDDLGWGDVGFNGGTHIETPHLDEMAANGLKFNRFYAQAPVCSPTRASVVTGRHHDRTGIYTANHGHLRDEEFTLYEALKSKGYATGHFGKWHMGTLTTKIKDANRGGETGKEHFSPPWKHEVDVTFATESKTPTFDAMWKPVGGSEDDFTNASRKGWDVIPEGGEKELYGTHYWTAQNKPIDPNSDELLGDDSNLIMDRALRFIDDNQDGPFLAIVWFHAPHLPVVASVEDAGRYDDGKNTAFQRNYNGCVTALDRAVGRLRAQLREQGIAENTMITFCSDNGPEGKDGDPGQQGLYRGRKRSLYEGGVRVPGLIEWPAKIEPGSVSDAATCTVDYFPTILEIVGVEMPDDRPLDGISLIPIIEGSMQERPQPLGFHIKGKAAWHDGMMKAHRAKSNSEWELYDLSADPGEETDLAETHPERLESMVEAWMAWKASVDASDGGADY